MILNCPDKEWLVKLGPITRTNTSRTREQSVQGAIQKVLDAAGPIIEKARELVPMLEQGIVTSSGCGEPTVETESPDPKVHSFELPNGDWFSVANSDAFGFRVTSKRQ